MAQQIERKAGEKTRQKLRDFGLPPEITEKPGLTMTEAYDALNAAREEIRLERYGPPPQGNYGIIDRSEGSTEVVGESHYTRALAHLFHAHCDDEHTAYTWAMLVRDPNNKHDENAVRVEIDGKLVGFLCQEDASDVADDLDEIARPVLCRARISTHDGTLFGVWLDFEAVDLEDIPRRPAHVPYPYPPQPPRPIPKALYLIPLIIVSIVLNVFLIGWIARISTAVIVTGMDVAAVTWDWVTSWF